MLSKKEEVEQFKRDLRSLNYYKEKCKELSDKLLELDRSMHEARANRYHHEVSGNTYNYVELMEKEDILKEELHLFDKLIVLIGDKLDSIDDEKDRHLLIDIYIHKLSYAKLSMQYFMSERNLKYYVDNIIRRIL